MRPGTAFPTYRRSVLQARYRAGDGFLDPVRLALWLRPRGVGRARRGTAAGHAARRRSAWASAWRALTLVGGRVVGSRRRTRAVAAPARRPGDGTVPGADRRPRRLDARSASDATPEARDAGRARGPARRADDDPRGDGGALAAVRTGARTCSARRPKRPPTDPAWNVPTSADFAFRLLDPDVADWRRPRVAVLARRLGARRRRGSSRPASTSTRPTIGHTSVRPRCAACG